MQLVCDFLTIRKDRENISTEEQEHFIFQNKKVDKVFLAFSFNIFNDLKTLISFGNVLPLNIFLLCIKFAPWQAHTRI